MPETVPGTVATTDDLVMAFKALNRRLARFIGLRSAWTFLLQILIQFAVNEIGGNLLGAAFR